MADRPGGGARTVPSLLAGDRFVLNRLLRQALAAEAGDRFRLELREVESAWPVEPFGPVAEVREAAGREEQVLGLVPGTEVAVTEMAPFTEKVIAAAEALRLIVVCRGRPVNANLEAAAGRGIPVCSTPARNAATAEYAVGLLLAAMRRLAEGHTDLTAGVWRGDFSAYQAAGEEVEGKTVGLIGFGAAEGRVTRIPRGFGAQVPAADIYVNSELIGVVGAELMTLDELLPRARVVSLHARLTLETRHILGRAIARLPSGAVDDDGARRQAACSTRRRSATH